jgi:hypothetical protein
LDSAAGTTDHDNSAATACTTCGLGYSVPQARSIGPWFVPGNSKQYELTVLSVLARLQRKLCLPGGQPG